MANCVVSTISALADVMKDEMEYKTLRDLTKKKETLMTQIRRVALKFGGRVADYEARSVDSAEPEPESEPKCRNTTNLTQEDLKGGTIGNLNNLNNCLAIGTTNSATDYSFDNVKGTVILGNLIIKANTKVTINVVVQLDGMLIMEENAKLIINGNKAGINCGDVTLNNSMITVKKCGYFNAPILDLGNTKNIVNFDCGSSFTIFKIKNTSNSQINIGNNSYGGTGIQTTLISNWKENNFGCTKAEIPSC